MSDTQVTGDEHVCYNCIGDMPLAELVRIEGRADECEYCRSSAVGLKLNVLAERIDEVVRRDFRLTPSGPRGWEEFDDHWKRAGEPVDRLIKDIAGFSDKLAGDVTRLLSNAYGPEAARYFDEDPYGSEARYARSAPIGGDFLETWESFKKDISCRSRFFSATAEAALSVVFERLSELRTARGRRVVVRIGPGTSRTVVFRARAAFSWSDIDAMLSSPVAELGPPPSAKARAGRMNASGISVFYGAVDANTCVAEIRAPVGARVVIGRFEIIRPLSLLDLDALGEVYESGSHFDADYVRRAMKAAFLKDLVSEITRPVMPSDEAHGYLPTQAIAEYLGQKISPPLDGIMFRSSQTGRRNLVLLNHACEVEPYILPQGTRVEVDERRFMSGEEDILVSEITPKHDETSQLPLSNVDSAAERNPVLRLDVPGIEVHEIKAVAYKTVEMPTSRLRMEAEPKRERDWDPEGEEWDDAQSSTPS